MKTTLFRPVVLLLMTMFLTSCLYVRTTKTDEKPGEFTESDEHYSFVQSYPAKFPFMLHLSTAGGNIEVTGCDSDNVTVSFQVRRNSGEVLDVSLEQLKTFADVIIQSEDSKLSIEIREIKRRNINVGFVVKTPRQTTCALSTSGGNIELFNLKGDQRVTTSGGNLSFEAIQGALNATTSGGNIELREVMGDSQVSTSGGNIEAKDSKGNLSAQTSGGNIELDALEGSVDVSTSGGNIEAGDVTGSLRASTSGGNVRAKMHKLTGNLQLETNGGHIDCTLPGKLGMDLNVEGNFVDVELRNFSGTSNKESIHGSINGGGIPVVLRNSGGAIRLSFE